VSGHRRNFSWSLTVGFVALLLPAAGGTLAAQDEPVDNCVACHGALGDDRLSPPVELLASDVHGHAGFSCVACHGGDQTAEGFDGMDPAKGFVGKPSGATLLAVCASCHSDAAFMRQYDPSIRVDQITEYQASIHGQRLARGDTLVATCSDCHTPHQIRPPSDPQSSVHPLNVETTCGACHANADYMAPYDIPTNQVEGYGQSIHREMMVDGGDLSAPTCNDCHGNHGAAPPGFSWVGNVCSQCHATMGELFRESRHSETFVMLGQPGCATCHGNHAVVEATTELLGVSEGAICAQCHAAGDAGGTVAATMRGLLDSLEMQFDSAHHLLEIAEEAGMEVSGALFELEGANNARIGARAAVHSFALDQVETEVAAGLEVTAAGIAAGNDALAELDFRRLGLAVSVTLILALIAGLLLKIREIDRSGSNAPTT
jgi:predicted CXXCH cytochrome family protein